MRSMLCQKYISRSIQTTMYIYQIPATKQPVNAIISKMNVALTDDPDKSCVSRILENNVCHYIPMASILPTACWIGVASDIATFYALYPTLLATGPSGIFASASDESRKPLELYGFWQTEQYMPPPVVDGKVPRNQYGNVYLFKSCMLPAGAVHLPIPGIHSIAKRLDIDAAPALIGWEFHGMGSHPVFDGVVVCEESREVLLDAWDREEARRVEREKENMTKRAIANWRRLTRGLLLHQEVRSRFIQGEHSSMPATSTEPMDECVAEVKTDNNPGDPSLKSTGKPDLERSEDPDDGCGPEVFRADMAWPQNKGSFSIDER